MDGRWPTNVILKISQRLGEEENCFDCCSSAFFFVLLRSITRANSVPVFYRCVNIYASPLSGSLSLSYLNTFSLKEQKYLAPSSSDKKSQPLLNPASKSRRKQSRNRKSSTQNSTLDRCVDFDRAAMINCVFGIITYLQQQPAVAEFNLTHRTLFSHSIFFFHPLEAQKHEFSQVWL